MRNSRCFVLLAALTAFTGGCLGSHGDTGGACGAQDAEGEGACRALLGYKFDGTQCVSFGGCTCVGADCDATYNSEEACLQACVSEDPPPPSDTCAAQDIGGTGDCRAVAGWAFDGTQCASVDCACVGSDCDAIFDSQQSCEARYETCLEPRPPAASCAPEYEGDVPRAPTCRPGAERWYFTDAGCVEGCACIEGEEHYGWPSSCPPSNESAEACRSAHPGCESPAPAPSVANCDRGDIGCRAAEPACPAGQVAEVVGSCWGACIPIDACAPVECTPATAHHCPAAAPCEGGFCRW